MCTHFYRIPNQLYCDLDTLTALLYRKAIKIDKYWLMNKT